jgi:trans-2,3-dihydro-3-hydroxyanthranilate isomerase
VISRRFVTLDVFTATRFAGNPLAVVLESEGLDTAAMQKIASEFNLSETVFLQPPRDPVNLASIRIFTPRNELPFAGHPTVGTAVLLASQNKPAAGEHLNFGVECSIGTLACTVRVNGEGIGRARFDLPRLPAEAGDAAAVSDIAAALGLEAPDIGFGSHKPARFQMGPTFTYVPLASTGALSRVSINLAHWDKAFGADSRGATYLYARGTGKPDYHARMFTCGMGFVEDPATGSAAAGFSAALMRFEKPGNGSPVIEIEQGRDMGRPSQILLGLEIRSGVLDGANIGGDAVFVSQGTIST